MPGAAQCGQIDGRAFEHAGADALARHFQQAEMRDAADLDARAVVLQRVLQRRSTARLLRFSSMSMKSMTMRPARSRRRSWRAIFVGRFEIGPERRVLDIVLAGRAARVDVDRDQRLGLVDDDVAAGLQRHLSARTSRRAALSTPALANIGCVSR